MNRLAWILLVAAACGSDANVAGNYQVSLTNKDNGCSIGNWMVGAQPTATATVVQDGSNVTLMVNGLAGVAIAVLLGTNEYRGDVSGDDVRLEVIGTAGMTTGNCAYTYNSTIEATLSGDTMAGRIEYRAATNGGTDCGTRTNCLSFQDFNATRPPS